MPYGDRGAGPLAKLATTDQQAKKISDMQAWLAKNDFVDLGICHDDSGFIDTLWDWDTLDYKSKHKSDPELHRQKLVEFMNSYPHETAVVLLHDFEDNHVLFDVLMQCLLSKNIEFVEFPCSNNEATDSASEQHVIHQNTP